jgi:hypothetical protein
MRKPIWFYDEVYQLNFWFMLGWKPKDVDAYLRDYFIFDDLKMETKEGMCIHFVKNDGGQAIVIWTRTKIDSPKAHGVLAHECVHAANMCFASRGVEPHLENDEPQAYLVAALVRRALGFDYKKNT